MVKLNVNDFDCNDKDGVYLNLGCGYEVLPNLWKNYDSLPVSDKVTFLDLEETPYKMFKDNSVDYIIMHNVLEHLKISCRMNVIKEIHRILKKGCIFDVELPLLMPRINHQTYMHFKGYFNVFLWFKSREKGQLISRENEELYFDRIYFKRRFYSFKLDFPFIIILLRWKLRKR